MSRISDLAQTFQQKSEQLANDTETALKIDFEKHEESIKKALNGSANTIENAIKDYTKHQSWLLLKSWLIVVIGLVTLILLAWGTIWYQGTLIIENYRTISEQNATLEALQKKTYGMYFHEDQSGVFVVAPKGKTFKDGWTLGKLNAALLKKDED